MPVSPQDYALWSDLTGNPYPQTPAERMALAPEVYSFTRDVNQGKRPPGAIRRAVDVIGKTALAAGAIAGGVYLAKNFGTLELDDEPHIGTPPQPQGFATASTDVQPPKTTDYYEQHFVPHQTAAMGLLRGTSPEKPTVVDSEEKPATQSHVITSSQSFSPGSEVAQLAASSVPHSPVRDRADDLISEYLGGVAAEQRAQKRIDQSVAEYGAMVAGKAAPVLKQVLKEGREEGISPVGRSSIAAAERFRGTPAYTAMMQAAGASMEPDELVGAPGTTPVFTEVRATPQTRIAPITSAPAPVPTPAPTREVVTAAVPAAFSAPPRRSSESEEAAVFAAKALALLPRAQREAILSGQADAPIVSQQPEAVRVGKPVKVRTNEFLSAMSQDQGPLASYEIEPERSKAISSLTFYPGGELGVGMKSRGKPVEYAYATSDPYRLAMRDYADEGFPDEMGNIAGIAANNALAHQMGLQKAVERGGTIREKRQPIYSGLMSESDIVAAGMGKNARAKEQAERHFETRQIMSELEQRAAARRAGLL
jgi:hypothetical protein